MYMKLQSEEKLVLLYSEERKKQSAKFPKKK